MLRIEARELPGGLIASRRVDTWHDRSRNATRLYDEREQLIAGEWAHPDGSKIVYRRGASPTLLPAGAPVELTLDDIWRLNLSSNGFAHVVGDVTTATVSDTNSSYVVAVGRFPSATPPALVKASLTLAKVDLHPTEQTITVTVGSKLLEFRFIETPVSPITDGTLPGHVFDPDRELVPMIVDVKAEPARTSKPQTTKPSMRDLLSLQAEVLSRLDAVGALLGEQVSLTRNETYVDVSGLVETGARRSEIQHAFDSLPNGALLRVHLATAEEAATQHIESHGSSIVVSVPRESRSVPVYEDLYRYFLTNPNYDTSPDATEPDRPSDDSRIQQQINRFTMDVLTRSLQARLHARALLEALSQFWPDAVDELPLAQLEKWRDVVGRHANGCARETHALINTLDPIFGSAGTPEDEDAIVSSSVTSDLSGASARLFELATADDVAIGRAFALSTESVATTPELVKAPGFWRSLRRTEALANEIERAMTQRPRN